MLGEAFSLAEGADRVAAAGWLGVLRAHQSRVEEALALLRPAARGQIGVEHTSATMHSLLFTGHAHALAGRPAQALDALARYTTEVERRQVPRFAGRAVNFAGWVLRNLGAWQEALDHHQEALEAGQGQGTADVTIAALEDLAGHCLATGDPDGARARLTEAAALLRGNLVFGWRLRLKHQLLTGRLALLAGDGEQALAQARELESQAAALGVPRYTSVARLLAHRARHALGDPADPDAVAADLDLLDGAAAIEAWWWTCDLAGTSPTIIVDTREQCPLIFERLESRPGTLQSGDYSVAGLQDLFSIERKTVSDLVGCCMGENRERFERELQRLRGYRFKRLLVVGSEAEILAGQYHSNIKPQAVMATLGAFEARYDVPVVFRHTPELAAAQIERWAFWFSREMVEVVNNLWRSARQEG